MIVTINQLYNIMPNGKQRIDPFVEPVNKAMSEFLINANAERVRAFLAQIAHESGEFRYVKELASGAAYDGRKDLGNTQKGDGVKYKGRGLIQITGRHNYEKCGESLGLDLINNPELLEQPINAARSAAWFWNKSGLNQISDSGSMDSFKRCTKIINGGYNGLYDRVKYWQRAQKFIKA